MGLKLSVVDVFELAFGRWTTCLLIIAITIRGVHRISMSGASTARLSGWDHMGVHDGIGGFYRVLLALVALIGL